jgi:uncharacterized membrane protein
MNGTPEAPLAAPPSSDIPPGLNRWIGRVLVVGVVLSALIELAGLALLLVRGIAPRTGPVRIDWWGIAGGLVALDPYSFFAVGLLVLVLTPFIRVLLSVVAYVRARDLPFVAMTLFVLLVLVGSAAAGVAL